MLKLRNIYQTLFIAVLCLFVFPSALQAEEDERHRGFTTGNIDNEEPDSIRVNRELKMKRLKAQIKKTKGRKKLDLYYDLYMLYADANRGIEEWNVTMQWYKEAERQKVQLYRERTRIARSFYCYNMCDYTRYDKVMKEDMPFFIEGEYWEDYDYLTSIYIEKLIARGRLSQASDQAQDLLLDAEQRNDVYGQGLAYQQLGAVEKELGYFTSAKKLLRKGLALQMDSRSFDDNSLAYTYELLFDVLFTEGNYRELLLELSHMQVLVDYWRKGSVAATRGDQTVVNIRQMTVWSYMSRVYVKMGRLTEAKLYMDKLSTLGFFDDGNHEKQILTARMDYHAATGDWQKAVDWGTEIRTDYQTELDSLSAYKYGKYVADIYIQAGQYKEACTELKDNIEMQQKIRNKFSSAMVLGVKEEIDGRITDNRHRDRQTILWLGSAFGGVLLLGIVIISCQVYRQKRNKEILDDEMLRMLGMRTDEFFMTIRRRISLHHRRQNGDTLGLAGMPMEKKKRYRRRTNFGPDRIDPKL